MEIKEKLESRFYCRKYDTFLLEETIREHQCLNKRNKGFICPLLFVAHFNYAVDMNREYLDDILFYHSEGLSSEGECVKNG